jgi:hypothetical protein
MSGDAGEPVPRCGAHAAVVRSAAVIAEHPEPARLAGAVLVPVPHYPRWICQTTAAVTALSSVAAARQAAVRAGRSLELRQVPLGVVMPRTVDAAEAAVSVCRDAVAGMTTSKGRS